MGASLDDIDGAIYDALAQISRPLGDTFASVGRYAGELSKPDQVYQEFLSRAPACLVVFDGEQAKNDYEQLTGEAETEGTSTWTVLVCTTDVRRTELGLKGAVGVTGAYALATAVQAALNALTIDGLIRNERLRYVSTRPVIMRRGQCYILAVRFTADRAVDVVATPDPSVPYAGIVGNIHLEDTTVAVPAAADPIDVWTDP